MVVAVGTIATLSITLLNRSWTAHQSAISHLQKITSLEQAIERWRNDLQHAERVDAQGDLQIEQTQEGKVVYSIHDQLFERKKYLSGKLVSQESWSLPANCEMEWRVDESGAIPLLQGSMRFRRDDSVQGQVEFDEVMLVARVGEKVKP